MKPIECSMAELDKVLDTAVKITDGFSLISLLDLYNQLNRIIKKHSRTHLRASLPKVSCITFKQTFIFVNHNLFSGISERTRKVQERRSCRI